METQFAKDGSRRVNVKIDGKNVGILYKSYNGSWYASQRLAAYFTGRDQEVPMGDLRSCKRTIRREARKNPAIY